MSNLNHSFTQMYKIDTILQDLQFKIPSINQGLELTYRLNDYIEKVDEKHKHEAYMEPITPKELSEGISSQQKNENHINYFVLKDNRKITLDNAEWREFETFLIHESNKNINMSLKKTDLDEGFYKEIYDNLQILLENKNSLSVFLKGLKYLHESSCITLIQDVVCGTLCDLIKTSLEKEKEIIEISMRLRLGENIFSAISSLKLKNIGKELKKYLYSEKVDNIDELVSGENIIELHNNLLKTYPDLDTDHTKMILLDNLKLTLDNIASCPQNYKFLPEYHKYFELDHFIKDIKTSEGDLSVGKISKGTLLQAIDNIYMKLRLHQTELLGDLGNCIITQFIKAKILKQSTKIIRKKPFKKLNVITVDYTDLTIFYSREFPRISNIIEILALKSKE